MAALSNNRRAPRKALVRDGILVAGRGQREISCTIADISAGGAGIKLADSTAIPETVYLISLTERRAYAAIIAWRQPRALGLKFVSVFDLGKLASKEHDFLSRIWIERAGR